MKTVLFNLNDSELEKFITDLGQPRFRAKQIREWLNRGAPDFNVMKNLPEDLRKKLEDLAETLPVKIVKKLIILLRAFLLLEKSMPVVIKNAKKNLLFYIVEIVIRLILKIQMYPLIFYINVIFALMKCPQFNVQNAINFVLLFQN